MSKKFSRRLYEKLLPFKNVTIDSFSDNSCTWINLKMGDKNLYIEFDGKGENIESISLSQDIINIDEEVIIRIAKS
jgi:hypothetical protein